jgi:hypothetical protein
MNCPFCGAVCHTKVTRPLHFTGSVPLMEYRMKCTGPLECGWGFKMNLEYAGTLSPSGLGYIDPKGNVVFSPATENPFLSGRNTKQP